MKLELLEEKPVSGAFPVPILFVHGMFHAAWCWAEYFLPYFAQHGYHSYALSLRGHGASEGQERLRWFSLAEYVSDVAEVVSGMERAPVLVGHSMGGMIVQKYLEENEAPAAVLLASAPPKGILPLTLRAFIRSPLDMLKAGLTLNPKMIIRTPRLVREGLFSENIPEQKLINYFSRMQNDSVRAFIDMMFLNLPLPGRVKIPVLVLGAKNDTALTLEEVEETARAYGTQAKFFADMAHNMMLEERWRAVADRMLEWLKDQNL